MAWWSTVKGRANEKHRTLVDAGIRINFGVNVGGVAVDDCGIYKQDPALHPNATNMLPHYIAKAAKKASG